MNAQMADEFREAIASLKQQPEVKALILRGAGEAFCAGGDLAMLPQWVDATALQLETDLHAFYASFLSITQLTIPTVAAINGAAIGAGACLAMACDLRWMAAEAHIGFTFVKLGINPGMGAEYFLTRLLGPARTMELLMTGKSLSAQEASNIGLVNHLAPAETLLAKTIGWTRQVAAMPALALKVIKDNTYVAMDRSLDEVLQKEAIYQGLSFQHANFKEGVEAMRMKRPPRFRDKL
jgi:enoyl-CoA hydratase